MLVVFLDEKTKRHDAILERMIKNLDSGHRQNISDCLVKSFATYTRCIHFISRLLFVFRRLSLIAPGVNHTSNENIRCPVISFYNIVKETLDSQSLSFITALSDVQLEVDSVVVSNLFSAKLQRMLYGNKNVFTFLLR